MRGCKRAIERGERGVRVKMGKGLQPQNGEKIKVRVFWGFRVFWVHECFFLSFIFALTNSIYRVFSSQNFKSNPKLAHLFYFGTWFLICAI